MDLKQKEIIKTLQVLLWIWFGTITSFVSVNVVNIAKLETENKILRQNITHLESRIAFIKEYVTSK
jgi:cell division protein FtsB